MRLNRKAERSAAAWFWRALMGPAMLVEGAVSTLTFGTVSLGASLEVSRRLALARIASLKEKR